MPRRDVAPEAFLADMLKWALKAQRYTQGVSKEQYLANDEKQSAVERCFEVIGEAAGKVDEPTRAKFPSIPFRKIKGMRDLLIHNYDNVKNDVLWETIERDLPKLIQQFTPVVEARILREREIDRNA